MYLELALKIKSEPILLKNVVSSTAKGGLDWSSSHVGQVG